MPERFVSMRAYLKALYKYYLHSFPTIKTIRVSVTEVGALYAAGWAMVCATTHATVSSARGWLGVVVARKADLNWQL